MALGWLAMLKHVPWGEVVSNAPVVTEGAKKLWNAVAKRTAQAGTAETGPEPAAAETVTVLQARLDAAELAMSELRAQLLASSELIGSLAEQNTQLIARAELNRVRLLWLARATGLLGVVAVLALVAALLR